MIRTFHWRVGWLLFILLCPILARAQAVTEPSPSAQAGDTKSDDAVSLGDLARVVRRSKAPVSAPLIIDNDNLSNVMDEVESHRLGLEPHVSSNAHGPEFALSSPDGTCSLSFNANAAATNAPFVSEDLPPAELAKIEGPATIEGDSLEVSMYNGSPWKLTEVTVGLTLVRRSADEGVYFGSARLMPAVAEEPETAKKPSELTILFHLKGPVPSLASNVFHEKLGAPLAPDQEWHWAIIGAKGIAPPPATPTLPPAQPSPSQ